MGAGYIETPYDITDKRWYTPDGDPRTIMTNGPGSISSHPSSSSAAPSFKSYYGDYNIPDRSLKSLRDVYRSLPSLDYEYKAPPKPKALTKLAKSETGHAAGREGMRNRTRLATSGSRNVDHRTPATTRVASRGAGRPNRENVAPLLTREEHPAPDYEYESGHYRAHAAPAYQTLKTKKASAQRPSRPDASSLGTYEAYDQRPGASWYRHPSPASTPASRGRTDLAMKESTSWYRSRPEVAPKRPVLRRSKAKVTRVSVVRTSLVAATPNQRQEGSVKTWYAGVKRKLFGKVHQNLAPR